MMSRHREMWGGWTDAKEQTVAEGQNLLSVVFLLVLAVNFSSILCIVQKLQAIKYKNDDRVVQWLKTSWATSGQVR